MTEVDCYRVSVDKPEDGMLRGLAVRIKRQEATDFSGSCGCAAKKKGASSGALRRGANVKLFLL